jgi:hypothetical protein
MCSPDDIIREAEDPTQNPDDVSSAVVPVGCDDDDHGNRQDVSVDATATATATITYGVVRAKP